MADIVKITGSRSGIILKLDPAAEWELLKNEVKDKFASAADFWGDAKKAVTFQGRELNEKEQDEILEIIRENCRLQIVCVLDEDPEKEAVFAQAVQNAVSGVKDTPDGDTSANLLQNDNGTGFFFKGNLRSGQVLDVETSVIILGDVNNGAKVISKGNVIILGSLKGNVFAGSAGNVDAFVIALDMKPVQIRIADTIARSPDQQNKPKKKGRGREEKETKIAFWEDGNIYIEPLDKDVMSDIRLS